jgi:hypothetical protein
MEQIFGRGLSALTINYLCRPFIEKLPIFVNSAYDSVRSKNPDKAKTTKKERVLHAVLRLKEPIEKG